MTVIVVVLCLAVGLSSTLLILRASSGTQHGSGGAAVHDVYEAAFLAGGPGRVVDCALAALHADGRIVVGGPGIATVVRRTAQDLVERAVLDVLAAAPHGALHTLRHEVMRHPAVQEIGDGLAARGLMRPPGHNSLPVAWGTAQGIMCLLALPFSFVLSFVEVIASGGPPVALLLFPALLAGLVIGFVTAGRAKGRVSHAGRNALRAYASAHGQACSVASVVALHGVRALPDQVLRAHLNAAAMAPRSYHRTAQHPSTSDLTILDPSYNTPVWCATSVPGSGCGSSSCGSSSGGSGCGGSSGSGCAGSSSSGCGSSSSSSCSSSSSSSCGSSSSSS